MLDRLAGLSTRPSQVRVGAMARRLATLAGIDPSDTERLVAAIRFSDIGMISLSEATLRKSGPLDDGELRILHRHPEIGARLLAGSRSPLFEYAAELAFCHHESWNGDGYPRKLVAEQIPIGARIIALADTFDGLLSQPPHGSAWSLEDAVQHIAVEAGRRYDPVLAQLFLDDLPMMLALRSPVGDADAHDPDLRMQRATSIRTPPGWPIVLAEVLLARTPSGSTGV